MVIKKKSSSVQNRIKTFLHSRANVHYRALENLNELTAEALTKAKLAKQADNPKAAQLWEKKARDLSNLAKFRLEKARTFNVAKKRHSSASDNKIK